MADDFHLRVTLWCEHPYARAWRSLCPLRLPNMAAARSGDPRSLHAAVALAGSGAEQRLGRVRRGEPAQKYRTCTVHGRVALPARRHCNHCNRHCDRCNHTTATVTIVTIVTAITIVNSATTVTTVTTVTVITAVTAVTAVTAGGRPLLGAAGCRPRSPRRALQCRERISNPLRQTPRNRCHVANATFLDATWSTPRNDY